MKKKENKNILIVDDDELSRVSTCNLLKKYGYDCTCVDNGLDAINIALKGDEENRPNVILMDWVLPDLDGLEATKVIKSSRNQFVYIIILTAMSRVEDLVTALDRGADDFISKPYDIHELIARVKAGFKVVMLNNIVNEYMLELKRKSYEIKKLKDLLPICCKCHKIRSSDGYWEKLERYLQEYGLLFSHGYCDECLNKEISDLENGK